MQPPSSSKTLLEMHWPAVSMMMSLCTEHLAVWKAPDNLLQQGNAGSYHQFAVTGQKISWEVLLDVPASRENRDKPVY